METSSSERPLGELLGVLAHQTGALIGEHLELASSEMGEKASAVGKTGAGMASGWLLLQAGSLTLIAAAVLGLGQALPLWASALLVGLLIVAAGSFLVLRGVAALRRVDLVPRITLQTLKEDKSWLSRQKQ